MVAERVDEIVRKSGHRAEWGNLKLDVLPRNGEIGKVDHRATVVHGCRDVSLEGELFVKWWCVFGRRMRNFEVGEGLECLEW